MGSLAEELMNELNCETAFTIPYLAVPVPGIRGSYMDHHGFSCEWLRFI